MQISAYWKSILAAVSAGAGVLLTALDDNAITTGEWLAAGIAALAALGVVAAVPNAAKAVKPVSNDRTERPYRM